MNGKKAKRLRQVVRLMQEKGVVEKEWAVEGSIKHVNNGVPNIRPDRVFDLDTTVTYQSMLKPECGKAVYKRLKNKQ